jgi:hypothetical protein
MTIMLEQCVVGVVGLEAAGGRISMRRAQRHLGQVWGMNQGTPRDNSGPERTVVLWP